MNTKSILLSVSIAVAMVFSMLLLPAPAPADDNESLVPDMKITPVVLNMKSRGKFITAHISLPQGAELPDAQDVRLHVIVDDNDTDNITAVRTTWDYFGLLAAKFSRSEVQSVISEYFDTDASGTVPLSVSIAVDNGTLRYIDSIRIKNPGKSGKGRGDQDGNGNGNENSNGGGNGHGHGHGHGHGNME